MSSSSSPSPEPSTPPTQNKRRKYKITDSDDDSEDEDYGDETVLSHAERRRQKRRKQEIASEESALKKRKLQDGKAAPIVSNRRQNSVWVGNMSFKTTQDDLRAFFEGVGEVTRMNMPTKVPTGPGRKGENRGFAYVDFATPEAKTAAIAKSELPLIGRKLLIKDGDDYTGRPTLASTGADGQTDKAATDESKTHSKTAQKILRAQKQSPAPTLFIGNLGFETTDDAIRELFEAHREKKKKTKDEPEDDAKPKESTKDVWIRKIRMGTFEDSGLCKGFAFVDFTTTEQATSVLINPKNHLLNGRKLVVEYAGADAVRRGAPKAKREEWVASPKKRESHGPRAERLKKTQHQDLSKSKNEQSPAQSVPVVEVQQPHSIQRRSEDDERRQAIGMEKKMKGPRVRPKPGAALALAKRETPAIVLSQGKKITF